MKSHILQVAAGVLAFSAMSAAAAVRYVDVHGTSPTPPYVTWTTAATTIQDAVDLALAGDLILVTNGVYQAGGRAVVGILTNRVAVDKPVRVQSVNGAAVTVIRGFQIPLATNGDSAIRCAYLSNGAALVGFTLTNGATRAGLSGDQDGEQCGGGVWCESTSALVSNCVLTGNSALGSGGGASGGTLNHCTLTGNSAGAGGGASGGTLSQCVLTGNSARYVGGGAFRGTLSNCRLTANSAGEYGGGAMSCTLNNCTVAGNSAYYVGGGADRSTLNNCIVCYNRNDGQAEDNSSGCSFSYSCTTPLPEEGTANFSNAPLFMDYPGGDLRLQSNSPCINTGLNVSAPFGPDLDRNPRIVGGTVDLGAYEFQSPGSRIPYAWLRQYGLPTDGSADDTDTDVDGLTNEQEWRAGTEPTTDLSVLRLLSPVSGTSGVIVSWESVSGRKYFLERGTELGLQPLFLPLATGIVGQPGRTSFTDTNAVGSQSCFYRVGVEE